MADPTYEPHELAPEVIKVGDKLHEAIDEITEDNGYFSDISIAIQSKTGQVEPYDKSDMASAISNLSIGIPIDSSSLTPLEFGVDTTGFYYADVSGGGTDVEFGRDANGLYVI